MEVVFVVVGVDWFVNGTGRFEFVEKVLGPVVVVVDVVVDTLVDTLEVDGWLVVGGVGG